MVVVAGEILLDCFPDGTRIGGAPFNVAFHLWHMGVPVRFLSRIGDDADGRAIRSFLDRTGFPTRDLQVDPVRPTGRVEVEEGEDGPSYRILPDVAYDATAPSEAVMEALSGEARMLYFGTLVQRTPSGKALVDSLGAGLNDAARCFVDVNLRAGCYTPRTVLDALGSADILKLNHDEFEEILSFCRSEGRRIRGVEGLMEAFGIEVAALTMGADGSRIYAGGRVEEAAPEAVGTFRNSVGAGDGFAAVLAMGWLSGWSPRRIVERATAFASRICTLEGAVPESADFYEDFTEG